MSKNNELLEYLSESEQNVGEVDIGTDVPTAPTREEVLEGIPVPRKTTEVKAMEQPFSLWLHYVIWRHHP
jgi:hypothetical protein